MKRTVVNAAIILATLLVQVCTVLMVTPTHAAGGVSQIGTLGTSSGTNVNTLNYTLAPGNNRALVVVASHAHDLDITNVTFNGQPLTQVVESNDGIAVDSIWVRAMGSSISPTTANIVVTRSGVVADRQTIFAVAYQDVDQTTPMNNPQINTNSGSSVSSSVIVTGGKTGDLVFDLFDNFLFDVQPTSTPGGGQTLLHGPTGGALSEYYGTYTTSTKPGAASVTMSWSGNGVAMIHLAANINYLASAPFMSVEGNSNTIANGDATPSATDHTDFGNTTISADIVRTFTIRNSGTSALNLLGSPKVILSGANPADFAVNVQPSATVGTASTTTFQVAFSPTAVGLRSASVSIANNDTSKNPYNFFIQGTGIAPSADLSITVSDGAVTATPGAPITYSITVSNAGPQAVTGATLSDNFPAALTGITWTANFSGSSSGATSGSGAINETINLAAGGSATYTVIGNINPAATGTLTNMATVTPPAGTTDPNPGNNSGIDVSTLTPTADLSITVTDHLSVVVAGEPVTYTLMVTNLGPSDVSGAEVSDIFPAALTGVTWTGPYSGPISGTIIDTINLAVGGTVAYTATGTVDPAATGTLTNTAMVSLPGGTTDPNPTNNSATDSDMILSLVTLTVTVNGNGAVNSTPNEIACTPACTSTKPLGSTLTLTAVPGIDSGFSGWSDACLACGSTPDCLVTFDATKNCTATFELLPLVAIDGDQTPYYDIATALAVPQVPATIRVQAAPIFVETITMTNPVEILLRGGYSDPAFTSQTGFTTISGSLRIQSGKLTGEQLKIKP